MDAAESRRRDGQEGQPKINEGDGYVEVAKGVSREYEESDADGRNASSTMASAPDEESEPRRVLQASQALADHPRVQHQHLVCSFDSQSFTPCRALSLSNRLVRISMAHS